MDVTTAFLNGELEEEVYMKQPECFIVEGQEQLVCKLKRSTYSLKQSPRCWNSALDSQLRKMGLRRWPVTPVSTQLQKEKCSSLLCTLTIVLAGKNDKRMAEVKEALAMRVEVKDMGELHHFLGMKVVQDQKNGEVWIGQPALPKVSSRNSGWRMRSQLTHQSMPA